MADTFLFVPTSGSQGTMTPRTLMAQFGDGYVQELQDGINNKLRIWELTFNPIKKSGSGTPGNPSLSDINTFLETQGGYKKFLWTQLPPFDSEGAKAFVCRSWSYVYDRGEVVGLRATFEQRPT